MPTVPPSVVCGWKEREDRRELGTSLLRWERVTESTCQEDPGRGERTAIARTRILTVRPGNSQGTWGKPLGKARRGRIMKNKRQIRGGSSESGEAARTLALKWGMALARG